MSTYLTRDGWKNELKKPKSLGLKMQGTGVSAKLEDYEKFNKTFEEKKMSADVPSYAAVQKALADLAKVAQEQSIKHPAFTEATNYMKKIVEAAKARVKEVTEEHERFKELKLKVAQNPEGLIKDLTLALKMLELEINSQKGYQETLKETEGYITSTEKTIKSAKDTLHPEEDVPAFRTRVENLGERITSVSNNVENSDKKLREKLDPLYKRAESFKDANQVKTLVEKAEKFDKFATAANLVMRNRVKFAKSTLESLNKILDEAAKKK